MWYGIRKKRLGMGAGRKETMMKLFKKKIEKKSYDPQIQKPVMKCSICNGEKVVGFQNLQTGKVEEVMFIRKKEDLEKFKEQYGITEDITKIY